MSLKLSPRQQKRFNRFQLDYSLGNFFVVNAHTGMGKSTLLRHKHAATGGAWLEMKEFVDALRALHPLAIEECFAEWLGSHLQRHGYPP